MTQRQYFCANLNKLSPKKWAKYSHIKEGLHTMPRWQRWSPVSGLVVACPDLLRAAALLL